MIPIGRNWFSSLTKDHVNSVIARADACDEADWFTLCEQALQIDTTLRAAADARANAVVSDVRWRGGDPFREAVLDQVRDLNAKLQAIAVQAPALGVVVAEMGFADGIVCGDKLSVVDRLFLVSPRHLTFAHATDEPLVTLPDGQKSLPPGKFLVVLGHGVGLTVQRGYMRRAIFPVLERQQLLAQDAQASAEGRSPTNAGRIKELDHKICDIVLDAEDRVLDKGMLTDVLRRIVGTVRAANAPVAQQEGRGA